jgi:hypothetical protein
MLQWPQRPFILPANLILFLEQYFPTAAHTPDISKVYLEVQHGTFTARRKRKTIEQDFKAT